MTSEPIGERRGGEHSGTPSAPRRAGLEWLFARLLPALARWAHGRLPRELRRRCDTMDLVQDACLGALRQFPDLDDRDPAQVDFYLRQAIRNRIRDEARRARVAESGPSEVPELADGRPGPHEEALETEERRRYRAALLELEPDDQQLIVGRVDLGLGYDELARATGRSSAEATRSAVRRAMFRLAREIARIEKREQLARVVPSPPAAG